MADDRSKWEAHMADADSGRPTEARTETCDEADGLPFTVELTDAGSGPRVLARAASASLARAIFGAACTEYPARRVVLKRGTETIGDSSTT
jgi:hypothetical protein